MHGHPPLTVTHPLPCIQQLTSRSTTSSVPKSSQWFTTDTDPQNPSDKRSTNRTVRHSMHRNVCTRMTPRHSVKAGTIGAETPSAHAPPCQCARPRARPALRTLHPLTGQPVNHMDPKIQKSESELGIMHPSKSFFFVSKRADHL